MTSILFELEQKASQLTADERAQLALFLLETLVPAGSGDIEKEWRNVAEARLVEIERGEAHLAPAEDVFSNVYLKLN